MNKTRCEIALDLSLRAVQHDLDGDSAFARKLYEDAARALEDTIAHAKKEKSMETNDIKQMESKVKEYRERAKILNATKGGDTCNEKESKSNVAAGAAAAGAMIGFAAMGPLGALGCASSMAYASTKKSGIMSSVSKVSGSAVLKTVERAKMLNNKYKIQEKVKENGKIAFEKAKDLDEKYKIREKAKTQSIELDEAFGVFLVIRARVIFEGHMGFGIKRVGRFAPDDHRIALVELEPHRPRNLLLAQVDRRL